MDCIKKLVVLAWVALIAGGCVGQGNYDMLEQAHRKSREQVIELRARLEETNLRIAQLEQSTSVDPKMLEQMKELEAENLTLRENLAEFERMLQEVGPIGPLPAELDDALMGLAAANAEMMSYDQELGMVKFQSDLTFDLGSVALKSAAASSLAQLATILNTTIASGYEVRVVGHTDIVPIRRASTRTKHPTNWHLSVHRAISVKDALSKAGIDEVRMGVAGYGKHRPVAENAESRGNEKNRRVEIFLLPMVRSSATLIEADVVEETPGDASTYDMSK